MGSVFLWPLRVYYEDTDAGGIVFYANYLKFFERARTEWLRAADISQQQLSSEDRCMFVVKNSSIDYHAPAKLDDRLEISVRVHKLGRASVVFHQEAWRLDGQEKRSLCSGSVRVGCVNTESMRPAPLPDHVLRKISAADTSLNLTTTGSSPDRTTSSPSEDQP